MGKGRAADATRGPPAQILMTGIFPPPGSYGDDPRKNLQNTIFLEKII